MTGDTPLVLGVMLSALAASTALNVFFLRRKLRKLDVVYNWIVGTPDGEPGAAARLSSLEDRVGKLSARRPRAD